MKLIVQIPCLNEAECLPEALAEIPRHIDGIDEIEVLIVDDGSTDDSTEVAKQHGADHVVRSTRNRGLAATFRAGIDEALRLGADIIVNTDADNQYPGAFIHDLVAPILSGEADMVIGDRQVANIKHFSFTKRKLQALGSWVVRQVSGTNVPDTTSGFRAFTRDTAQRLNIVSDYTYTLESIIQAGKKRFAIASVPIEARATRPSRLMRSNWDYVKRSAATIIRIYAMYEPLKFFSYVSVAFIVPALVLFLRYLYLREVLGEGQGHVQSVVLGAVLMGLGALSFAAGLIADIIASNRRLIEETLHRQRLLEGRLREDANRDRDRDPDPVRNGDREHETSRR